MALSHISDQMKDQNDYSLFEKVFTMMLEIANSQEDPNERIKLFYNSLIFY